MDSLNLKKKQKKFDYSLRKSQMFANKKKKKVTNQETFFQSNENIINVHFHFNICLLSFCSVRNYSKIFWQCFTITFKPRSRKRDCSLLIQLQIQSWCLIRQRKQALTWQIQMMKKNFQVVRKHQERKPIKPSIKYLNSSSFWMI